MKAIILVGGFGTRLQSVLADVPKPMAPIGNKPFLAYLIDYLAEQGIKEVILSVHYLREQIQNYFKSEYEGVRIHYAVEEVPLGTGGAIAYALKQVAASEPVFVLNGDTFVKLDYQAMYTQHQKQQSNLTIALRSVEDCQRYGKVITEEGVIVDFREKGEMGAGWINAGIYLLQPDLFSHFQLSTQFSFESDFLQPYLGVLKSQAFAANDYFIDIGIPEDYARATKELPREIRATSQHQPKISVIMPVYNREDTIEKAILSVLNQHYPNTELIILDGGSTDKTIDVIKKYQAHITYWHSKKDKGAGDATNAGFEIATGEVIGLLMADDWYEQGIFQKVGQTLNSNPDVDIISFPGRLVRQAEDGQFVVIESYDNPNHLELSLFNICYRITGICFRFIRRATYQQLGPFLIRGHDEKQLLTNDKEFLFRLVLAKRKNKLINHLGYTHLAHSGSFSFSNNHSVARRHCQEHIWIAGYYLSNKALSLTDRMFIRMWRNDQAAKLVLFNLLERNIPTAFKEIKAAWAKDILWPLAFVSTTIWVASKRFFRRFCSQR